MKNFPLSQLPPRKFTLGDRVQNAITESRENYIFDGTVIGYHYEHPVWVAEGYRPGWVYTVLKTYDSESFIAPFITYLHEDEIELIEGLEHTWMVFDEPTKARLFGSLQPICSLLQRCIMRIEGAAGQLSTHIDCGDNELLVVNIWRQQSVLRAALRAWYLPDNVLIFHNKQVTRLLQSSFEIPPIINPTTMSENNPIIQRASRHQSLIKAIGASAVAASLHDANDGFQFLDLYASDPRRLNKPREVVIGQPANIIDPRISEPRIHHIREALANGQQETFTYTYEDEYLWKFQCAVTPIYGTEEVIVITSDLEDWQRHHWLNKLN